jgi:NADH-quinone oxidoreductase subunit C
MEKKNIIEALRKKFPEQIMDISSQFGDEIIIFESNALLDIANFLNDKPYEYTMLLDLTCVDYKGEDQRFEMVYHFLSLSLNDRIRLKTRLPEKSPKIDSLTSIWKNANWLEREVYDMFGIHFNGHPYLIRIFMYEGFEGHPLRKDYPLRKQQPRIRLRKLE